MKFKIAAPKIAEILNPYKPLKRGAAYEKRTMSRQGCQGEEGKGEGAHETEDRGACDGSQTPVNLGAHSPRAHTCRRTPHRRGKGTRRRKIQEEWNTRSCTMDQAMGFGLYRGAETPYTLSAGEGPKERQRGGAHLIQALTGASLGIIESFGRSQCQKFKYARKERPLLCMSAAAGGANGPPDQRARVLARMCPGGCSADI